MAYRAEYIWIDGTEPVPLLRSKTKILPDGADLPIWNFDGSSTNQAPGDKSDCVLKPVFTVPDPIRGGDHKLVLCEVFTVDVAGEVHRDLEHDVVDQVQVVLDQPGGVLAARRTPVRDQGPLGVPGRSVLGKCCAHVAVSLLVVFRVSPRDQPDPGDCPRGIGARTRRT